MMLTKLSYAVLVVLASVVASNANAGSRPYEVASMQTAVNNDDSGRWRDFNSGWKFMRGSFPQAVLPLYDDEAWQRIDIPHDYSIVGIHLDGPDDLTGPFSKTSEGGAFTGYTVGGEGWYRKQFILPSADTGKVVKVHFDGVYSESEVWINGHRLGFHPNGYTPFYYDLTPFLRGAGEVNVIAVRTLNHGENSRWYAGSGIYRDVHLSVASPVHIKTWGLSFNTLSLTTDQATVALRVALHNQSAAGENLTVKAELISPAGEVVGTKTNDTAVDAGDQATVTFTMAIKNPSPWSVDHPQLYRSRITLLASEKEIDRVEELVGIRTIAVTPTEGLMINGSVVELKGANIHHDNGLLGARALAQAEARKVQLLKDCGYNAIRTSHNPPSKHLLDACDRLGMLVVNEFFDMWEHQKKENDYHQYFAEWSDRDLAAVVARDKNHPAVIAWSIGNEVYERADSSGIAIAKRLTELTRTLDPTRPITAGVCDFWDHKGRPWEDTDLAFQFLDIAGYNYQHERYASDHKRHPSRVMLGTESYAQEAYDNWQKVQEMPWVIGDFVWTGMDYIGEAGIGHSVLDQKAVGNLLSWPWYNAWCGDLDITGSRKPQSYYRDVVWQQSHLEIAVRPAVPEGSVLYTSDWGWPREQRSWTWPGHEGQPMTLAIYSPGPFVTVMHNGKQVAHRKVDTDSKWITLVELPYAPGAITVIASDGKQELATQTLVTTGQPVALRIAIDQPVNDTRGGLVFAHIEVVDENGDLVPNANPDIKLEVTGPGTLIGAGNGDPTDLMSFNSPKPKAFEGKAFAIIKVNEQADGAVVFQAGADGLQGGRLNVTMTAPNTGTE